MLSMVLLSACILIPPVLVHKILVVISVILSLVCVSVMVAYEVFDLSAGLLHVCS